MSEMSTTNPTHDLFFYALHGDVPGMLSALESGADPNATIAGISSVSVSIASLEGIPLEARKKAWVVGFNKLDPEYERTRTPLLLATEFDHYDSVLTLLEHGADPGFADEDGTTPLWAAAQRQQPNIMRVLLHAGVNIDAADCLGQTALFRAVEKGDLETVRLLLAAGADANRVTPQHITPLLLAARRGQQMMIHTREPQPRRRDLLSDQVDEMRKWAEKDKAAKEFLSDEELEASLMKQKPRGDYPAIMAELLALGADARFTFPPTLLFHQGTTALHEAAALGCEETVRLLLDHGAELEAKDGQGTTPLGSAASSGNIHLVQWLLEKGARVNGAGDDSRIPLIAATTSGHDMVKLLLDYGADISASGATALHRAAGSNKPEVIRLLVARGVDVNNQDSHSRTPLMIAVKEGAVTDVQALLDSGADIHAKTEKGKTAWDLAQIDSPAKQIQRKVAGNMSDSLIGLAADQVHPFLEEMVASDAFREVREESARTWARRAAEGESKRTAIIELLRIAGAERT